MAVSPATHPVGGPGTTRPHALTRGQLALTPPSPEGSAGHPPAATPNVRDPFRVAGEGPGATPTPDPSSQYCDWELRGATPGVHLRLWASL
jgi:hypothetical protein